MFGLQEEILTAYDFLRDNNPQKVENRIYSYFEFARLRSLLTVFKVTAHMQALGFSYLGGWPADFPCVCDRRLFDGSFLVPPLEIVNSAIENVVDLAG